MALLTGLDILLRNELGPLRGKAIGLVCNQASIARDVTHGIDALLPYHRRGEIRIQRIFGPQHGLFGHTQDNMIEWEGATDPRTGISVVSLYGEHREPTPAMLEGIDELVVDLPAVGSRYYTFIWTMALCMRACEPLGIPVMVLDRPNPIGGINVEGTLLRMGFDSFVGQYPLPTRHGMTIGEIARYLQTAYFPKVSLNVVEMVGWDRRLYGDEIDFPWAMPSPNMPSVDTAMVYPGACLLEATNLSEGRGTTRPFEIFGAPFLDSWKLADGLNSLKMPGCRFRPLPFEPTFNKHAGRLCGGCFLHVTDREVFEPVLTFVGVLQEIIRQSGHHELPMRATRESFVASSEETDLPGFAWKLPPYEYVWDKRPIEILAGNAWLADAIDNLTPLTIVRDRFLDECAEFAGTRNSHQNYAF